ncbi:hypothetical protein ZIOFF_022953 [Zingiber officinale]|uniref:DUF7792 domain-containing protein n=2 Tax=Zingiber officinale TaxID=94328 RepID=A0A8J5H3N0_ZINOF|nr:hypothetical protein ZIOFF_022953 [Zingiber officinale]
MMDGVKQMVARPTQLAEQMSKFAADVCTRKQECLQLKDRADELIQLLHKAACADLYLRPARRIIYDTEQALEKALALVEKCRHYVVLHLLFTIVPDAAFVQTHAQLQNSVADVSWLLRISTPESEDDNDGGVFVRGLCPIAENEPVYWFIWDNIAAIRIGGPTTRSLAAATLVQLASDNRFARFVIEEDGVEPLLRLLKEGEADARESAARALGHLGRDAESVDYLISAGVCPAFAKALTGGPMKVQAAVGWAVAELVAKRPKCQGIFAQNNLVRLLVPHLDLQQPVDSVSWRPRQVSGRGRGGREVTEDPDAMANMKAMAAKALSQLAKSNAHICLSITECGTLLNLAALLEKGTGDARYYAATALLEIALVAEHDDDLRRSAFKPNSPSGKAVIAQFVQIVNKGENEPILISSITALGCLSTAFRVTETDVIGALVRRVADENSESAVRMEALTALTKFAISSNLFISNCKAMLDAGVVEHLMHLVYLEEQLRIEALVLLCHIVKNVPESEGLKEAVQCVLTWASRNSQLVQVKKVDDLLQAAVAALEEPCDFQRDQRV